jgi:tetratricopeptide (TPR) repeat protein
MPVTLTPQDLMTEGKRAYQAGKYPEAAAAFTQASRALAAENLPQEAAEASNNASVAYLKAGDAAKALKAAEGTDLVFASVSDLRRQGMAVANQAAALDDLGRLDEALERYTQSSALLKQCGEKDLRSVVLKSISALQIRTGKQLQALASMDAALENQKRLSLRESLLQKLLRLPLDMLRRR